MIYDVLWSSTPYCHLCTVSSQPSWRHSVPYDSLSSIPRAGPWSYPTIPSHALCTHSVPNISLHIPRVLRLGWFYPTIAWLIAPHTVGRRGPFGWQRRGGILVSGEEETGRLMWRMKAAGFYLSDTPDPPAFIPRCESLSLIDTRCSPDSKSQFLDPRISWDPWICLSMDNGLLAVASTYQGLTPARTLKIVWVVPMLGQCDPQI